MLLAENRLQLEPLVDLLVVRSSMAPDVIEIMLRELEDVKLASEQDPEPADGPGWAEEPANDWPGART